MSWGREERRPSRPVTEHDLETIANQLSHLLVGDQPPNWALVLGAHLVRLIEHNQEELMGALEDAEASITTAIDAVAATISAKDATIADLTEQVGTLTTSNTDLTNSVASLQAEVDAGADVATVLQADADRLNTIATDAPVEAPPVDVPPVDVPPADGTEAPAV